MAIAVAPAVKAHQDLFWQIEALTRQIQRDPGNAQLHLERGRTALRNGDLHQADLDFDTAESLDRTDPSVHWHRAELLAQWDEPEACVLSLDRFLSAEPRHVPALLLRARCLAELHRDEEALQDFEAAGALKRFQSPTPFLDHAALLAARDRIPEAIRVLDEGIHQLGPAITLMVRAVELEENAGQYDAALARLEPLLLASPRKENWLFLQGRLHQRAGRESRAARCYTAALAEIDALPEHLRETPTTTVLREKIILKLQPISIPHDPS